MWAEDKDDDDEARGLEPYSFTAGDFLRLAKEHEMQQGWVWNPVGEDGGPTMPEHGAKIAFRVAGESAHSGQAEAPVHYGVVDRHHRLEEGGDEVETVVEADGEWWFLAQIEQWQRRSM